MEKTQTNYKSIKREVKYPEFQAYVKQRLREGNPLSGSELQDMFKEAFSSFFETAFNSELDDELGYSKYDYKNRSGENARNGTYPKTLKSGIAGEFQVDVPRDRNGNYEPQIVKKHEKDISSIDDKII